jgi:glutaredoxin 3
MKKVVVYTTAYCGYCIAAKRLLQKREIPYEEVDASDPTLRAWLAERSGQRTVPQIFFDDTPIGGYTELKALDAAGGLLPRLA